MTQATGRRARTVISVAVVAAAFGLLLPRFASYQGIWANLSSMPWPRTLLVAAIGAGNLFTYWVMIVMIMPILRLRQAAVLNLGTTAIANSLPAGVAVALGATWAMLSSWGVSTGEYVLYTLLSGVWNTGIKLLMPILAVALLASAGESHAVLLTGAIAGLAVLLTGGTVLMLAWRSNSGRVTANLTWQHTHTWLRRRFAGAFVGQF